MKIKMENFSTLGITERKNIKLIIMEKMIMSLLTKVKFVIGVQMNTI